MSDADLAYAAAERLIAAASQQKATSVQFDHPDTAALTHLPPELARLTSLHTLILDNTSVTDAGLEVLRGMKGLRTLWLSNTSVTDVGFEVLRGLTSLQELRLDHSKVTDAGLEVVRGMIGLQMLILSSNRTTEAGLEALMGLTGLRGLWLNDTEVRDLRVLKDLKSLEEGAGTWGGLNFKRTPATRLDPELLRLSEILDDKVRTKATLEYLRGLGEDWPPVPEAADEPDAQNAKGLIIGSDALGRMTHDRRADGPVLQGLVVQFHAILCEEVQDFQRICPTGHNTYGLLGSKLDRYRDALTPDPETLVPHLVWKYGNDLRILLRGNKDRMANQIDDMPRLDVPFRDKLEALVASHNVLCDAHPVLLALDLAATDPAERERAEANRHVMAEMVDVLGRQAHLIVEDLRRDMRDLHDEAQGESPAAQRALGIEDETLRNVIRFAVAEAMAETKDKGKFLGMLATDVRSAAVGVVVLGIAQAVTPGLAPTYMALVAELQPYIGVYLASWPTPPGSMQQIVDYLMVKLRNR